MFSTPWYGLDGPADHQPDIETGELSHRAVQQGATRPSHPTTCTESHGALHTRQTARAGTTGVVTLELNYLRQEIR